MQTATANPFHKPNPFKFGQYEKFQHPHLNTSTTSNLSYTYHPSSSQVQPSRYLNNSWAFNENNFNKNTDFNKKYDTSSSQVTDFEMRLKMSSVYVVPSERPKPVQIKDNNLQNPFLRKNLLVNRDKVNNQVQMDLSIYRQKTKSNYEAPLHPPKIQVKEEQFYEREGRMSFGTVTEKTPNIIKKESNESNRNPEEDAPKAIEYKHRKFFLIPVLQD